MIECPLIGNVVKMKGNPCSRPTKIVARYKSDIVIQDPNIRSINNNQPNTGLIISGYMSWYQPQTQVKEIKY